MPKKNPFIFTVGFNSKNPSHIQVANILNKQGKGNIASFIVKAILAYQGIIPNSFDPQFFKSMIEEIVKEQIMIKTKQQPETGSTISKNFLDNAEQENILNGLTSFREK